MKPTVEMVRVFESAWDDAREYDPETVLTAVMPLIVEAVAEQIAQKIEDNAPEMGRNINITPYRDGRYGGMLYSAVIAREWGKQ